MQARVKNPFSGVTEFLFREASKHFFVCFHKQLVKFSEKNENFSPPLLYSPVPRHTFLSPRHACLGQGKIRKEKNGVGDYKSDSEEPQLSLSSILQLGHVGFHFILLTFSEGKK